MATKRQRRRRAASPFALKGGSGHWRPRGSGVSLWVHYVGGWTPAMKRATKGLTNEGGGSGFGESDMSFAVRTHRRAVALARRIARLDGVTHTNVATWNADTGEYDHTKFKGRARARKNDWFNRTSHRKRKRSRTRTQSSPRRRRAGKRSKLSSKRRVLARYRSKSGGGLHEIRRGADGKVYCTCPAWRFSKSSPRSCAHLKKFKRRRK